MRMLGVAIAVISVACVYSSPSLADDYDKCNSETGCRPDDQSHDYCFTSSMDGRTNLRSATHEAINTLDTTTRFGVAFRTSCGGGTDLLVIAEEMAGCAVSTRVSTRSTHIRAIKHR
jgi:hypothetical protein